MTFRALLFIVGLTLAACATPGSTEASGADVAQAAHTQEYPVKKTDAEWREQLSAQQYRILREKGTERAFTGEYYHTKTPGTYVCAACGAELFKSDAKYDSGTGWPSFYEVAEGGNVETETDRSLGMTRTEIKCSRCGGHLGHVFEDGPKPTGLRYCVNSASLSLKAEE